MGAEIDVRLAVLLEMSGTGLVDDVANLTAIWTMNVRAGFSNGTLADNAVFVGLADVFVAQTASFSNTAVSFRDVICKAFLVKMMMARRA